MIGSKEEATVGGDAMSGKVIRGQAIGTRQGKDLLLRLYSKGLRSWMGKITFLSLLSG